MARAYVNAQERELHSLALVASERHGMVTGKAREGDRPLVDGSQALDMVWWLDAGEQGESVVE